MIGARPNRVEPIGIPQKGPVHLTQGLNKWGVGNVGEEEGILAYLQVAGEGCRRYTEV